MRLCRLLRVVGRRITTDHHRARVTKQILDIELAGIDSDRPGSRGVAEAVGVNLPHSSPHPVTGEHDVHVVIAKRAAVKGLEEVAFAPAPEVLQVPGCLRCSELAEEAGQHHPDDHAADTTRRRDDKDKVLVVSASTVFVKPGELPQVESAPEPGDGIDDDEDDEDDEEIDAEPDVPETRSRLLMRRAAIQSAQSKAEPTTEQRELQLLLARDAGGLEVLFAEDLTATFEHLGAQAESAFWEAEHKPVCILSFLPKRTGLMAVAQISSSTTD